MESRRPSKRGADATAEAAEDRLSALPDDLLHSILREVPLKYAVRTSALSRRWPHLWLDALAASPVLDFSDHDFARRQLPVQAAATVRRCLQEHAERDTTLDAFRVAFRSPVGGFRLDVVAWIAAAVARNAREVEVDLTRTRWLRTLDDNWDTYSTVHTDWSRFFLELPARLFMAKNKLARLALVRCSLRAVPAGAAGLAGLRALSLSHVDVTDMTLRDLVANLLSLEFLSLRSCNLLSYVKVAGKKLRRLELMRCLAVRDVCIKAPALESFAFHGNISCFGSGDSIVVNFGATPALQDAYLSHLGFHYTGYDFYSWHCFAYYSLLNCVARATNLTICSAGLQHIDAARAAAATMDETELRCQLRSLSDNQIDVITRQSALTMDMPNLQELQLLMPSLGDADVDRISGFFEFTRPPILDRLFIHLAAGGKRSSACGGAAVAALASEDEEDEADTASNSDLVLDHLKFIKVVNFRGTRCEVRLLRFLVSMAPALEQVVLVTAEEEQGTLRDEQMKIIQGRVMMAIRTASPGPRVTVCRPSEDGSRSPARTRFYHKE